MTRVHERSREMKRVWRKLLKTGYFQQHKKKKQRSPSSDSESEEKTEEMVVEKEVKVEEEDEAYVSCPLLLIICFSHMSSGLKKSTILIT